MRPFTTALGLLLLYAIAPPVSRAAVLVAMDLAQLVEASDYVVVAQPQKQSSRYAAGLIVTDVDLQVISALKGSTKPGATLVVTNLGGSVDRIGLTVPGSPRFVIGRSVLVFLRRVAASDELNVTGMSQGLMPIVGSGASAQVQSGAAGAALMQRDANGALTQAAPKPTSERPLTFMLGEIERLVAGEH